MLPFVAAGGAAGAISYFVGLPVTYAVFIALAVVVVFVGVSSALTVKVPPVEPKPRKVKQVRRNSTPTESDDKVEKAVKPETTTETPKVNSKRDKERAKKAAKKDAEDKAEAARKAVEEEKQRQAEEAAERTRLAVEAADGEKDKKKKKKKKSIEEKDVPTKPQPSVEKKEVPKKTESAPTHPESVKKTEPQDLERKTESKSEPKDEKWEDVPNKKGKRVVVVPTPVVEAASTDLKGETDIYPKNYALIIGKGGSTLKLITEATQTSIDCKKDDGKVTVIGASQENINKAINAIKQLNTQGWSDLTHSRLTLPANKRFNVLGPQGQTVKSIQDKLNVKIKLPDKDTEDTTVTVTGDSPSDVQQALQCLQDLIEKGYSSLINPDFVSETIDVPAGQLGRILGAKGANVRVIQDSTGAKINVVGNTLVVVGQQSQVTDAKQKILILTSPPEILPVHADWSREVSIRNVDLW